MVEVAGHAEGGGGERSSAPLEAALRKAIHLKLDELLRGVTASVGVAAFPAHGKTAAELLRAADSAMYAAKREGRSVVWSCDPMHGNTVTATNGKKTRHFDAILSEVKDFFAVHRGAFDNPKLRVLIGDSESATKPSDPALFSGGRALAEPGCSIAGGACCVLAERSFESGVGESVRDATNHHPARTAMKPRKKVC